MNWPWSKPTPPPAAPAGSPERARRIARAADEVTARAELEEAPRG